MYTILDKGERIYTLEDFVVVMAKCGCNSNSFDGERDSERFTIQPYQFEPRIDSDEADSNPEEGVSGDESDNETTNPRLQNSDWYVRLMIVKALVLLSLIASPTLFLQMNG